MLMREMHTKRLCCLLVGAITVLGLTIWLIMPPSSGVSLPEMLQGLPKDLAQADLMFGARVLARFPSGTPLQDVVHALESQGFKVSADGNSAGFAQPYGFFCSQLWRIYWNTGETQDIRGISGGYQGSICL